MLGAGLTVFTNVLSVVDNNASLAVVERERGWSNLI